MPNTKEDQAGYKEKLQEAGKKVQAGASNAYDKAKTNTAKAADKVKEGAKRFTSSPDQAANKLDEEIREHLKNIIAEAGNLRDRGKRMSKDSTQKKDQLTADGAKKLETMGKKAQETCTKIENEAEKLLKAWESKAKARLAELEKEMKQKEGDKKELARLAQAWADSTRSAMEKQLVKFEADLAEIDKAMNTAADEALRKTKDKK